MASGAVLLDAAARRLAIDLLPAIDAARRRRPVATREAAAILHHRALLSGGALRQVGMGAAGLRPAGNLAAKLLALLDARTMLAELLARCGLW